MKQFMNSVQSFVHSVTTNDRYASYGSQYGSSKHSHYRPQDQATAGLVNDNEGLSQVGVLHDNISTTSVDGLNSSSRNSSTNGSREPSDRDSKDRTRRAYVPGMRSNHVGNGGIPLQDYSDGIPPAPNSGLSWERINRWLESHYPELYDQVNMGVTSADLNELESDLNCTLPLDVRDSYMLHDGQERGGKPTGIIFGITILDLESISEEWTHWKNTAVRVNKQHHQEIQRRQQQQQQQRQRLQQQQKQEQQQQHTTTSAPSSSSVSAAQSSMPAAGSSRNHRALHNTYRSFLDMQESVPPGAIQRVYAHPGWIPLAKDFEGNNVGVDLAPGPRGRWGQVILFGRDFDRKYVIAPSWSAFLANLADDLEAGNHLVDDDIENGALIFRAPSGRLVPYFDVLKSRVDRALRHDSRGKKPAVPMASSKLPSTSSRPSSRTASRPSSRPATPNSSAAMKRSTSYSSGMPVSGPSLISPNGSTSSLPATGLPKEKKESIDLVSENTIQNIETKKGNKSLTEVENQKSQSRLNIRQGGGGEEEEEEEEEGDDNDEKEEKEVEDDNHEKNEEKIDAEKEALKSQPNNQKKVDQVHELEETLADVEL